MRASHRTRFAVRAAAAVGIAAVFALTGCTVETVGTGGGSDGGGAMEERTDGLGDDGVFTVAAFTAGYGTPAGKFALDDFVEKGKAQDDWKVTLYTSDFDYDKINSDVTTAISQGADAILAGFPDPRQIAPLVQAADDAGIPIFSIDGGVEPNPDFVVDVTFDQEQLASDSVAALGEGMGGIDGKNVMVIGHDPHIGIQTRSNLALDMLTEQGATIAGGQMKQALSPATGRQEALDFVADYVQANPGELDGVWCGWDDAALGVTKALQEAGYDDVPVTGVDALAETAEAIKADGPMYATMSQDWIAVVDQTIEEMNAYRDSAELPEENFVTLPSEVIDDSNVDSFEPTL